MSIKNVLFFFIIGLNLSCEFKVENNTKEIKDAELVQNGLFCDGVELSVDDKPYRQNNFIIGQEIDFKFVNLKRKDNSRQRMNLKVSFFVLKDGIDTVKSYSFPIDNQKEMSKNELLNHSVYFNNIMPISDSLDHKLFVLFEEQGTKNWLSYKLPFKTLPNKYQKIVQNGLYCDYTYLFDRDLNFVLTKSHYDGNGSLWFVIGGLNGLEEGEGVVFPSLEILVMDVNNNILYENNDHFEKMSKGVSKEELRKPFGVELKLKTFPKGGRLKIVANLKDNKSNKSLIVNSEILVD